MMGPAVRRTAQWLGFAGLLPFIAALLYVLFAQSTSLVVSGLTLYALAIVSFLAGAWWGIALLRREPAVLVSSNVMVIVAWAGVWLLGPGSAMMLLAMLLLLSLFLEGHYRIFSPQPGYYRRMRKRLTWVAAACLVLVAVLA